MSSPDRYAVFGHPISHSKSPEIHTLFAHQTQQHLIYTAEDVPPDGFTDAVRHFFGEGGKGLNITVPLKELAWKWADRKTPRAELSKAVNTLALQQDGSVLGDNTDGAGLIADLTDNHGFTLTGKSILVLGAGGASRGILEPLLAQAPARLVIANRTVDKAINLAREFDILGPVSGSRFSDLAGLQFDLIINATSASLSGQIPPLPEAVLSPGGSCYDLAYGTDPTPFVRWGQRQRAHKSVDGAGMLVEQAAEAFYIWRQIRPDTKPVIECLFGHRGW